MKGLTNLICATDWAAAWLTCTRAGLAADIYGTITLRGIPPPEITVTQVKSDPNCGKFHAETPTTHFYVVGANGGLSDVVVSLKGLRGKSVGSKAEPLVIDQKGCEYEPYISACETDQKIIVKNSDPVMHNVHVTPRNLGNQELNRAQWPHGPELDLAFGAPENFLRFKCDIHPWMFAYVSVFDHPWFAVSGENGAYRIHSVPPGQYTLVARHRKAGEEEQTIVVNNQDLKLDFSFTPKPR